MLEASPTFISQDGHSDGEEGAEHIQQGDGHPQGPVIFTLGALGAFLNSCSTQFVFENTAKLLDKGTDKEKNIYTDANYSMYLLYVEV